MFAYRLLIGHFQMLYTAGYCCFTANEFVGISKGVSVAASHSPSWIQSMLFTPTSITLAIRVLLLYTIKPSTSDKSSIVEFPSSSCKSHPLQESLIHKYPCFVSDSIIAQLSARKSLTVSTELSYSFYSVVNVLIL